MWTSSQPINKTNVAAIETASDRVIQLVSRAQLQTSVWPSRSLSSYADAAQIVFLRDYLVRVTYRQAH